MGKREKHSMYDPYYSRIQGLLFEGMSIPEVHEYLQKYFNVYGTLDSFKWYVKDRKLDWFMPMEI